MDACRGSTKWLLCAFLNPNLEAVEIHKQLRFTTWIIIVVSPFWTLVQHYGLFLTNNIDHKHLCELSFIFVLFYIYFGDILFRLRGEGGGDSEYLSYNLVIKIMN